MSATLLSKDAFLLHDLADATQCRQWIASAERAGFASAPVTTDVGPVHMPGMRNNTRVMIDDPDAAGELWARLGPRLPERWRSARWRRDDYVPCGLNERLRFYRYTPGQRFATHRDGAYVRSPEERSLLTVLLFLSDDFVGGETRILEPRQACDVTPKAGSALCFAHRLLHEGATLREGCKYILRTDVMYRNVSS